jgi:glutamyl-tRNA synthetase
MQQLFSLEAINRAPSTFNPEKMAWINQQYLKSTELDRVVDLVKLRLEKQGVEVAEEMHISSIVDLYRERVKTINELAQNIQYFFQDFDSFDAKAAKKVFKQAALQPLEMLHERLSILKNWDTGSIHQQIRAVTEELQVNMGKVGQPLRVAVTGGSFSPPIDQTVQMIGQQTSLERIQRAIDYIKNAA